MYRSSSARRTACERPACAHTLPPKSTAEAATTRLTRPASSHGSFWRAACVGDVGAELARLSGNGGVTRRGVAFRGDALREPLREWREPSSEWREPSSP